MCSKEIKKKCNVFKCILIFIKPYHLTICLPEEEMDNYKKSKWSNPILNIGRDIILNLKFKECEFNIK
jgi:hypothetical protein